MDGVLFRLGAASLLSLFCCSVALACRCSHQSHSASVALKKYDGVFSGKVISINDPRARREDNRVEFRGEFIEVTFRVVRSWKLVDSSEITILTPLSSCPAKIQIEEDAERYTD